MLEPLRVINFIMKMDGIQVKIYKQNINIVTKNIFLRHLDTPVDPQELLYICSIADNTASHRILVKPIYKQSGSFSFSTPDLGQSPTSESSRKQR